MTARVSRSFLKAAKGKGLVRVETRATLDLKNQPRGSAGWPDLHLEGKKRGRFPVADKTRRTEDGHVFDSLAEKARYTQLKLMTRAGLIVSAIEVQPSWEIMINGQRLCVYTADFAYECKDRGPVIEDVKTSGTQKDTAYRLRKRAAELQYGIKVTEVLL